MARKFICGFALSIAFLHLRNSPLRGGHARTRLSVWPLLIKRPCRCVSVPAPDWGSKESFLMHRRSLIFGAIASSYFGARSANAWPLVTRQQPPSPSGAPTITIEDPDVARPVRSPVNIRIRFQPAANARIAVNSLRVRYGALGIDITRRILAHARPTQSGVFVEDAELPRGRHRVTIQIADNMGRVGSKSFDFNVV
jgi:hypothetical protein